MKLSVKLLIAGHGALFILAALAAIAILPLKRLLEGF
jgi:hypothetical protein